MLVYAYVCHVQIAEYDRSGECVPVCSIIQQYCDDNLPLLYLISVDFHFQARFIDSHLTG